MIKVLTVFGTRPEAIKLAPVIRRMQAEASGVSVRICVSGQHREMLDQALALFAIRPDVDLALMQDDQRLGDVVVGVMQGLEPIMAREHPDWVLVQGDTTTAMAASLAAFYRRIPVAHVEAGLRTGDKTQPFPEELHRRMIDAMADLHFAPTAAAAETLRREGVAPETVLVTGNTVIDALLQVADRDYQVAGGPLDGLPWDRRLVLVTAHRRENFGEPLARICQALELLTARHADLHVVYPVHQNPQVRAAVQARLGRHPRISLLPPLDYRAFVYLMQRSTVILTDSGGLQEEAPALGKPVLVLRNVTDRPEAVEAGTVRVIGTEPARIVEETSRLLTDRAAYGAMACRRNPYGDGQASARIVEALLRAPVEVGS